MAIKVKSYFTGYNNYFYNCFWDIDMLADINVELIIEQHIVIEFEFTPNYPAEGPIFKLDLPENEKLSVKGRQAIVDNLNEQVCA